MPTSNRQNFSKTGLKSHHFPSYAKSQTYDAASTSPDELAAPAFVQTAAKRRRTDGKSGESIEELESQRSITDEQLDLQHKATADELLAKADPAEPAAITSDTDDEADKRRIDIQPSEFLPSKKSRSTGQTNNNSCIVKQVFPVQGNSLLAPSKERWLLEYDVGDTQRKKNALKFRDSDGKEVLLVDLSKILKIEYGQDSAKTIIFTSANQDTSSGTRASGTRIHIELESADASTDLRSRLKKVEPTINLISKGLAQDGENYLDRVFQRPNNHRLMPVPTKPSKLEADDLQLIESNSHARNEQKWKEKQKAREGGQTRSSTLRNEATDTPQVAKSKGLARNMQVDQEPIHTMIQSTKSKPVEPQAFYGNGFSQRSLRSAAEPDMVPTRSSLRVPGRNAAPRVRAETPPPPPAWTEVHPEWHKDWNGTVYYPPGGRKGQVTVERDDILRLNEGEFLNDNLVTFYLRYLEHELQQTKPEVANRIYFQNSYFYPTLTKGVKKGINYQAVQRWTRTVDIFAKDYIIVPVCENLHWYVAIICNASKLLESKGPEEDVDAAEQDRKDAQAPAGPFEPSLSTDRGNTNGDGSVKETNDSPASVPDDADLRENKVESLSAQASSQEKPVRMPDTDCDLGKSKLSVAHPKDENKETTLSSSDGISDLPILHRGDEAVTNASDVDCIVPVEDHPIANVKSDILPRSPPKKAASNRKAKRISRLPLRDPAKPRIIILDSLGLPHSATCTNLKQYLVAEIKDKKGKNVEPPKEIGMLARNISLQDNHSDCGLYLLAYITKFLEAPDDFVSGVYQKRTDLVWQPKASEMRNDVRSLLLNLQKNIVTPKSGKSRSKRTEKAAKERQGSLKTQDYAQQLPSKTETSKAEQDHVATPLTKSLSPKPEVHTYATKQTFTESKGGRSPELGPSSSGHREEDEIHRDAGISESCPMEIDDSPENKRFTDASQQGRRSPAREALAPSPKSQSSSSQNSAESSSTLPQRQTEDVVEGDNSVHQSAASMLPDPPSTPGLRYPLVGDGRRSDSHTPGLSMSVIMDEPLPRVEGGADALCADSSPQSIDEPDCGDDLDTSRSQIVQPSAENHEPLPSDDDNLPKPA
ncbi:putative Ubiquitin-like-specific protease 2 [Glarea lozoyensis 74030]|uniref:Putative Ubiquitin-like-specific protease 2 n=1 Tax=Glarea lozoyensis (strain ATCC 74030 / MF5533) TaxID=1104152 RepID=H0EJH1_GLAL7|nr:putative Ubiquitin-like-specific protease 2 [Glarea lozoyensis 74030]